MDHASSRTPSCSRGGPDPLKGGLAWAGDGVQVDTLREVGQGEGVRLAAAVHKLGHIVPAGQLGGR